MVTAGLVVWEKTWPEAPAGQHQRPAVDGADAVALPLAHHVQRGAGDPATGVEQQVDGECVRDHLDLGCPLHGRDQSPLDLGAGRVTTGVGDPVTMVAALAGQAELAVGVVVELRAESDQLAHRLGALGDQRPHGLAVAGAGARDQGVPLVLRGGIARAERRGDAALRPLSGPSVEDVLGHHHDPMLGKGGVDPQRGGEPGDAGPDDHHVGPGGPPRLGSQQAGGHGIGRGSVDDHLRRLPPVSPGTGRPCCR